MTDRIRPEPPHIIDFVTREHENFLISLVRDRDAFILHSELQSLYAAAISSVEGRPDDLVLVQLLVFLHFHFLFAHACFMRCHLSEAFASARAAIDAALNGAHIIHDRPSGAAYLRREKPFDNFARHLGNQKAAGQPLPHPMMQALIDLHKKLSMFAVHADVGSFIHRARVDDKTEPAELVLQYFQLADDPARRKLYGLQLTITFVAVLDVFSDFLVLEQGCVPVAWQENLRVLGGRLQKQLDEARKAVAD